MQKAKNALLFGLDQLEPIDLFTICAFNATSNWFKKGEEMLFATVENITAARLWVNNEIFAHGGTDIFTPYREAMALLVPGSVADFTTSEQSRTAAAAATREVSATATRAASPTAGAGADANASPKVSASISAAAAGGGGGAAASGGGPAVRSAAAGPRQRIRAPPAPFVGTGGGGDKASKSVMPAEILSNHSISFIILITDGSVANEEGICGFATSCQKNNADDVRTYTYGIGPYANKYFLSMLADATHGYSDVCLFSQSIADQMVSLMSKTAKPVLSSIYLGHLDKLSRFETVEVFPQKIPDLGVFAPLVVAGKYTGRFPGSLTINGTNASGTQTAVTMHCIAAGSASPLLQMVAKHRIALLVGKWWLYSKGGEINAKLKEKLRQDCVNESVKSCIPCVFTQTIGYRTAQSSIRIDAENVKKLVPNGFISPRMQSSSGEWTVYGKPEATKKLREAHQRLRSKPALAQAKAPTLLLGSAVVLGTAVGALLAFGNVNGTMNNWGVGPAMDSLFNGGFEGIEHTFDLMSNVAGGIDVDANQVASTMGAAIDNIGGLDVGGCFNSCQQTCCFDLNSVINFCNGCPGLVGTIDYQSVGSVCVQMFTCARGVFTCVYTLVARE